MQLHIMDSGAGLLEVPYICYHCGGRSDNLKELEMHISKHTEKLDENLKDELENDDAMDHMLKISELVEVEIKEEPEFLLPLDLSKKVTDQGGDHTWIKEESCEEYNHGPVNFTDQLGNHVWLREEPCEFIHEPLDGVLDPLSVQSSCSKGFPRIRVVSDKFLQTHIPDSHPMPFNMKTPMWNFGNYFPCSGVSIPTIYPRPFFTLGRGSGSNTIQVPKPNIRVQDPRPRTLSHFPTPLLLEVPYICYHCGGRSPDLETLKKHINTMHNPLLLLKQKEAASMLENKLAALEAKRKLKLVTKVEKKAKKDLKQKIKRIKIPKVPKEKIKKERKKKEKIIDLKNRPFQCPFCTFRAKNFRGLIIHSTAIHHKDRVKKMLQDPLPVGKKKPSKKKLCKLLLCLFCDYRSYHPCHMKKHTYAVHGKQKKLDCPFCPHKSAYNLDWHILTHHKYKCPYCDFRCISKEKLTFHEEYSCNNVKRGLYTSRRKLVLKSEADTFEDKLSENENDCAHIETNHEIGEENIKEEQNISSPTSNKEKILPNNEQSSGPSSSISSTQTNPCFVEMNHEKIETNIKLKNNLSPNNNENSFVSSELS